MRRVFTILCLGSCLLLLGACASTETSAESDAPCICGTPEATVHGCAHPACLDGGGDPDNPGCHCIPIRAADAADENGDS